MKYSTLGHVLKTHDKLCRNAKSVIETKGRDYNRKQQNNGDTLFNLTVAKQLGIVDTVTQSILVRISDKVMRLISLTVNPKENPAVKDESVRDTIEDTINYLVYLYCKYEEERCR
jgi:VCBS repeat-containing protein